MFLLGLLLGLAAGSFLTYRYHKPIANAVDYWADFWRRAK